MRSFYYTLLLAIGLLFAGAISAQEQIGTRSMGNAGINGAAIQPAGTVNNSEAWEVNLFDFGQHLTTNYGYLANTGLLDLLRVGRQSGFYRKGAEGEKSAAESNAPAIFYDYYPGREKRYAYIATSITGPSASIQLGEFTRVGILTRFRVVASSFGLDEDFSFYPYYNQPRLEDFEVSPFDISGAAWSEVGFNVAQGIETSNGQWNIGITARYLVGHRAGYFKNLETFQFEKLDPTVVSGLDIALEAGLTDNLADTEQLSPERAGSGFGVDLGVQYRTGYGPNDDYRWTFGVSLLDVGGINFDRGAQRHLFQGDSLVSLDSRAYTDIYKSFVKTKNIDILDVVERASEDILDDPDASQIASSFFMRLPTALSVQADYTVTDAVAVNATVVGGLPSNRAGLERGTMAAITPRYETKWYAASLPVIVENGREVRVGAAVRIGYLTLGSEDLGSILGQSEVNGTDFYAGVKLFPFGDGNGRGGFSPVRIGGRRSRKDVKCYQF